MTVDGRTSVSTGIGEDQPMKTWVILHDGATPFLVDYSEISTPVPVPCTGIWQALSSLAKLQASPGRLEGMRRYGIAISGLASSYPWVRRQEPPNE